MAIDPAANKIYWTNQTSGTVRVAKSGLPFVFQGTVTVGGPAASAGVLGLSGTSLRGSLGGRIVG